MHHYLEIEVENPTEGSGLFNVISELILNQEAGSLELLRR